MPRELLQSCESGMEFLKQPSSVHAYAEVEAKLAAKDDTPSDKAKGFLQRKFKKFVDDYDEHHDWADLSRVVLSEGVSVWCCGRCCTVIEQNPSASFKELRQKTGCPLVQSEGDGGSSIDEERQQALEEEVEELKAALAASKRAASEQPGATMPPALPDLLDRSASVTKTEGKVGQPVSVGDLQQHTEQQTQHLEEQMQQQQTQQTQHLEEQMQQQMQQMQQQMQEQMQQMEQQMQQKMQQQTQQQTQELTGILRTSKSSTSDSGSNRRPSVASKRPSRGSTSSLRPKEQARALSKGSKPTKATGPYLGGESNKKEGIKI